MRRRLGPVLVVLLLGAPVPAGAAERLRAVDPVDPGAQADLREVRVTTESPALTLVVRFAAPLRDDGPLVEVDLGALPVAGSSCGPRASGVTTIGLRAAPVRQRATVRTGSVTARPIVWAGVDDRELVVHVPGRAAGSGAITCIAARVFGAPSDELAPSIPVPGTWPLLSDPSHDSSTGRMAVTVESDLPGVRIRFQSGRFADTGTVLRPTGPYFGYDEPFRGTVVDARPRVPEQRLAWRAIAANAGGTGYSPPLIARFEDIAPPTVKLRGTRARPGGTVTIRGELRDDSGQAALIVEYRQGVRVLGRVHRPLGRVPARGVLARFRAPMRAGNLVACGVGVDRAGNRSVRSCVTVRLERGR